MVCLVYIFSLSFDIFSIFIKNIWLFSEQKFKMHFKKIMSTKVNLLSRQNCFSVSTLKCKMLYTEFFSNKFQFLFSNLKKLNEH